MRSRGVQTGLPTLFLTWKLILCNKERSAVCLRLPWIPPSEMGRSVQRNFIFIWEVYQYVGWRDGLAYSQKRRYINQGSTLQENGFPMKKNIIPLLQYFYMSRNEYGDGVHLDDFKIKSERQRRVDYTLR